MMNLNLLKDIILRHKSFLLTTHVNPDADAIGSEIAFYFILKELGKDCFIINHSETPYNLEFLDADKRIEKFDENMHKHLFNEVDVLVALDFNRSDRIVSMQKCFKESGITKICLDHHQDPEDFADHYFIDSDYSATGQIIYDLITKTNIVPLKKETAYPIYTAIMTDTGSFRFERTTPGIHYIAANLLEHGVDPSDVFDKVYDQSKFSKIKLLGKTLASMELYGSQKEIGYMIITRKMFQETGAIESDTDGFVNYTLSVENVKVGLLFIELGNGFKVSFRSKGEISVNKLAAKFGGGGHINAAGARFLNQDIRKFITIVLEKTEEFLELIKV
jgi:bifunctional oligoribonuclease and PAP phosphatase NrnA